MNFLIKNSILVFIFLIFIVFIGLTKINIAQAAFDGGAGTVGDPYQISTCAQLQDMDNYCSSFFILVSNIDCDVAPYNTGSGFDPVCSNYPNFKGGFDGDNYTINGLFINRSTDWYVGLFSKIYGTGVEHIKDVNLTNINITGFLYVGAIVGYSDHVIMQNIAVSGSLTGDQYVGGIVGALYNNAIISNSHSSVSVSGTSSYIGGLSGGNFASTIDSCYSTGTVTGDSNTNSIGGLIGKNSATISKSFATGNVSGNNNIGGFAGYMYNGLISNCYATGNVSGNSVIAGLIGYVSSSSSSVISNVYSTGTVTSVHINNAGGLISYFSGTSSVSNSFTTSTVSGCTSCTEALIATPYSTSVTGCYYDQIRTGKTVCYASHLGDVGCTAKNTSGAPDSNYWFDTSTNGPMGDWDFSAPIWYTMSGSYPLLMEPQDIQFTNTNSSVSESATSVNLEVSIGSTWFSDITVDYAVTGGTATGSGIDYTLASGTATITSGNTTVNIPLTINDDTLDEINETIIVTLSNPTQATLGANTTYTYTIIDNDDSPTVTLSRNNASISEDGSVSTITATLSAVSGKNVTINLIYSGTATGSGADYTASGSNIVILAGDTTGTVNITSVSDTEAEGDETVIVDIDSVTNGTELGIQQLTITIINVDVNAPTVSLTSLSPDPHSILTPTIFGTATDIGGVISSVEYQLNGVGNWIDCTASDGVFNELSEEFSCTTTILQAGKYTIYVRATDNNINIGSSVTDDFTIISGSASIIAVAHATTQPVPVIGKSFQGNAEIINGKLTNININNIGVNNTIKYIAVSPNFDFIGASLIPYNLINNHELQLVNDNQKEFYFKLYNSYGFSTNPVKLDINDIKHSENKTFDLGNGVGFGYYIPRADTLLPALSQYDTGSDQKKVELLHNVKFSGLELESNSLPTNIKHTLNNLHNYKFIHGITHGKTGEAVRRLQIILSNYHDIYPEGIVSGYFGDLTKRAVQRFQMKYKIVNSINDPGYGYVGPKTRAVLNTL